MRHHFQGTLPYMSINLLTRWTEGNRIYHNPNDDLESSVWVGMIRGLEESVKYGATKREESWLTGLLSHNAEVISDAKRAILLMETELPPNSPRTIHAFYGLIVAWLKLVRGRAALDGFGSEGLITEERYLASYREFFTEGFTWLGNNGDELHKVWCSFFSSQKDNGAIPRHW